MKLRYPVSLLAALALALGLPAAAGVSLADVDSIDPGYHY
jgi:hypothetical protein